MIAAIRGASLPVEVLSSRLKPVWRSTLPDRAGRASPPWRKARRLSGVSDLAPARQARDRVRPGRPRSHPGRRVHLARGPQAAPEIYRRTIAAYFSERKNAGRKLWGGGYARRGGAREALALHPSTGAGEATSRGRAPTPARSGAPASTGAALARIEKAPQDDRRDRGRPLPFRRHRRGHPMNVERRLTALAGDRAPHPRRALSRTTRSLDLRLGRSRPSGARRRASARWPGSDRPGGGGSRGRRSRRRGADPHARRSHPPRPPTTPTSRCCFATSGALDDCRRRGRRGRSDPGATARDDPADRPRSPRRDVRLRR
jgi:hypothetical protein